VSRHASLVGSCHNLKVSLAEETIRKTTQTNTKMKFVIFREIRGFFFDLPGCLSCNLAHHILPGAKKLFLTAAHQGYMPHSL
jgi:hypothetical protein